MAPAALVSQKFLRLFAVVFALIFYPGIWEFICSLLLREAVGSVGVLSVTV
jgi:hypothetical protein